MSIQLASGQVITIHQNHWGNVAILAHAATTLDHLGSILPAAVADSGKVVSLVLTGQFSNVLANSPRRYHYSTIM